MAKETQTELTTDESLIGKEVAVSQNSLKTVMIGGKTFAVINQVTVPVLKHETGETVTVRIMQEINLDESNREIEVEVDGIKRKVSQTTEINVVRVIELSSGGLFNLVLGAVAAGELRSAYPFEPRNVNGIDTRVPSYVGKCFAIQKLGVVAGKRYKDVRIVEIADVSV